MMSVNRTLVAVLAVQSLLVAATWWPSGQTSAPARSLVPFAADAIDEIRVEDAPDDKDVLRLERTRDGWAIASAGEFPADPEKVEKVVDDLAKIEVRDPIVSTNASHADLSVADDHFDKRVTLKSDEGEVVLYLGGKGRNTNVRVAGEDAVYSARGLSQWSVGASPRSYYDAEYIKADPASFDTFEITGPDHHLVLHRDDENNWAAEGAVLDQEKVGDLLRKVSTVRISALPDGPPRNVENGVRVEWTVEEGGQSTPGGYVIGPEENGKRVVKALDRGHAVLVTESSVKDALDADLAELTLVPSGE